MKSWGFHQNGGWMAPCEIDGDSKLWGCLEVSDEFHPLAAIDSYFFKAGNMETLGFPPWLRNSSTIQQ